MSEELPAGWVETTLGAIAPLTYGKALPGRARVADGSVAVYGSSGVVGRHNQALIDGPALIIGRKGSVGAVHLAAGECWPIDTVYYVEASPGRDLGFLKYLLERLDLKTLDKSTAIPGLSRDDYSALPVRIPPLAEQRRIVAALDEHLSDLDAAVAGLVRARKNTVQYRNAVISASVVGAIDSGAPVPAAVDDLRLPKGWRWVALRDAAEIKGGITKGQKRRAGERTRGVPYLRVANVQRGHLDLREVKCIEATECEIEELRLLPGDVLFNEGGDRDKLGRGWVWAGEIEECIHQNHVFRARLDVTRFNPKFVSYFGNTWGQRYFLDQGKQTTNLASINLTKLSALQIPAPAREVQDEIVDRLEQRLAIGDRTAAEIDVQLARAGRLRRSILKTAFEGRLVRQDPNDEPVAVPAPSAARRTISARKQLV